MKDSNENYRLKKTIGRKLYERNMKTGIVDVGGGLRGIYAAGVFDWCLDHDIRFDLCIGVSAGSANVTSFIAEQRGRNYRFYAEYSFRKKYMGIGRFLLKKSFIDLDYVYGTLSNSDGEAPLDYQKIMRSSSEVLVVATNAETGDAKYFDKSNMKQDCYDILKASSAIPLVCRPYSVDGIPYYDGALSDPVPIEKAFSSGCEKVVLILTKPKDIIRISNKDEKLAAGIRKKYPLAAEKLCKRAIRYNEGVELAKQYEKKGKLLILAPDDTCGMDTLTRDPEAMKQMYEKGIRNAQQIKDFLNQ